MKVEYSGVEASDQFLLGLDEVERGWFSSAVAAIMKTMNGTIPVDTRFHSAR